MAKLKNLLGQKFGRLTVIERAENDANGRACWLCKCECGTEKVIRSQHLLRGNIISCGCAVKERENLIGQRFNNLIVLSRAEDRIDTNGVAHTMWNCKCDCGNYAIVEGSSLKSAHTKSCGCLQGEHHMDSRRSEGKSRLYRIWQGMKQRCYNENNDNFVNYGKRGIAVCNEWKNSYNTFKQWALSNGYDDNLSIDRIDVNGNYEPLNCRWATITDQANNTRNSKYITYRGETLTVAQWRKKLGFKRGVLEYRLKKRWDLDKVFNTPVKQP